MVMLSPLVGTGSGRTHTRTQQRPCASTQRRRRPAPRRSRRFPRCATPLQRRRGGAPVVGGARTPPVPLSWVCFLARDMGVCLPLRSEPAVSWEYGGLYRSTHQAHGLTRSVGLSQGRESVSRPMPHRSQPQASVLALWSFAMAPAPRCGITGGGRRLRRRSDARQRRCAGACASGAARPRAQPGPNAGSRVRRSM